MVTRRLVDSLTSATFFAGLLAVVVDGRRRGIAELWSETDQARQFPARVLRRVAGRTSDRLALDLGRLALLHPAVIFKLVRELRRRTEPGRANGAIGAAEALLLYDEQRGLIRQFRLMVAR